MKTSAGLLVYMRKEDGLKFLVVHPSGRYNEEEPFFIPKGEFDPEEETPLEAAIRETLEETGVSANIIADLGYMIYPSKRKKVFAYLAEFSSGKLDENLNCLEMDWENDIARFLPLEEVLTKIHHSYIVFIEKALEILNEDH